MTSLTRFRAALGVAALSLATAPAFAHHAMDGAVPATLGQGLLSGIAHPVIGLDHFAFVVAVAWLLSHVALTARVACAALFVAGTIAGTVLHVQSVDLPASELLVALSVVAAGLVLLSRRLPPLAVLAVALPMAGVLHGYAYGESIVGAETTPFAAYLLGFALIQFVLITGGAALIARLALPRLRYAALATGVAVAGLGAWFVAAQLPGVNA